jgi:hypothetical protein
VAKVTIAYVAEFMPNTSYLAVCPIEYPIAAPVTTNFLRNLFQTYPILRTLCNSDLQGVVTALSALGTLASYHQAMSAIGEALKAVSCSHGAKRANLTIADDGDLKV